MALSFSFALVYDVHVVSALLQQLFALPCGYVNIANAVHVCVVDTHMYNTHIHTHTCMLLCGVASFSVQH